MFDIAYIYLIDGPGLGCVGRVIARPAEGERLSAGIVQPLLGVQLPPGLIALGLIQGMSYGIIAVGLVLVYRSNRLVNFAHGEIGAFGAAVCGLLVVRWHTPYWLAFAAGIAVSALAAGLTQVAVVRRLRSAPSIMSLVATLGAAQFLLLLSATINTQVASGSTFPQPPGLPTFSIGVLRVTPAYSAMLFLTPIVVAALALFLRHSRLGLALRAAAANDERAQLVGISSGTMSTVAWVLGGALAAYSATLIIPTRGFLTAEFLGPALMLRALVPAVLARLTSLPVALAAGVGVGLAEQVLVFNYPTSGVPDLVLFAVIVGALLLQRSGPARERERADWRALLPWDRLPSRIAKLPAVKRLPTVVAAVSVVVAVAVGLFATNTAAVSFVSIAAFALLGLSVGVVTGLSGQLSLGQFALAGIGALVSAKVLSGTGLFPLALVAAVVAGAVAAGAIGAPALRIRGLMLGVTSLAFAVAARRWLFSQSWAFGDGVSPGRPFGLSTTREYYWAALVVVALGFWAAANVWRGEIGLRLRAVRDNEDAARSFGVAPSRVKLEGFVIAGGLAGLAGAVYGHLLSNLSAQTFDVASSVNAVALTVLGGIGILAGPFLGALYIIGVPAFLPLDSAGLAATALGWLVLVLYFPGGLARVLAPVRDRIVRRIAGAEVDAEAGADGGAWVGLDGGQSAAALTLPARPTRNGTRPGEPLLEATGLVKSYGGVVAVDKVTVDVRKGEILGVIGSNGAGKTTLFELLSGFTRPDAGSVRFRGRDITGLRPEQRADLGLVRSFQDAALFPTLTVVEAITLAVGRGDHAAVAAPMVGVHRAFRQRTATAEGLADVMGLGPHRDKAVAELSTGTRRVVELACVLALGPELVLLDEPSSGIAQREVEALGQLLERLREQLDATFVLIEHDIPMIMGLAGRIVAMDAGRVIATGLPDEVRRDPGVVAAYLGADTVAVARSGVRPSADPDRCAATTRSGQRCRRRAVDGATCTQHAGLVIS